MKQWWFQSVYQYYLHNSKFTVWHYNDCIHYTLTIKNYTLKCVPKHATCKSIKQNVWTHIIQLFYTENHHYYNKDNCLSFVTPIFIFQ
jgi:hypothetical protein